jgi:recombination protein RecA
VSSNFLKALGKIEKKHKDAVRDPATAGIIERITLPSPNLNFLFGGGQPRGRIIRFHGPESGGKTTLATYLASIVQKQEEQNIVIFLDFERTFDIDHARDLGMDVTDVRQGGKFLFLRPENGEEGFTIAEELVRTREAGLVIIDSDTTMPTSAMIESEYGKANFGGSSKLMSEALRKFNILLEKYNTSMIIISQERANMCVTLGTTVEWTKLP